jgi:hypothetical protein
MAISHSFHCKHVKERILAGKIRTILSFEIAICVGHSGSMTSTIN